MPTTSRQGAFKFYTGMYFCPVQQLFFEIKSFQISTVRDHTSKAKFNFVLGHFFRSDPVYFSWKYYRHILPFFSCIEYSAKWVSELNMKNYTQYTYDTYPCWKIFSSENFLITDNILSRDCFICFSLDEVSLSNFMHSFWNIIQFYPQNKMHSIFLYFSYSFL